MAVRHSPRRGDEPSGNTYRAIVAIDGQDAKPIYRASLSGAYEGAQRVIDRAWDNGSTAVVTVVIYHKPYGSSPWKQVDTQTIPANGILKHYGTE